MGRVQFSEPCERGAMSSDQIERNAHSRVADVERCYRLFLGRDPESDSVVQEKLKQPKPQMVHSFLSSTEFRSTVVSPVLEGRMSDMATVPGRPSDSFTAWAADFFPVTRRGAGAVRNSRSWRELRAQLLRDPLFESEMRKLRDVDGVFGDLADRLEVSCGSGDQPLFDPEWYAEQYSVKAENAFAHYRQHGAAQGYDPHPLFDSAWYALQAPELSKSRLTPRDHFLQFGVAAGLSPHPLFDAKWYLAQAGEVGVDPVTHYLAVGVIDEFDPHPLFSNRWYLRHNEDVAASGINPLLHYVRWGGRTDRLREVHPLLSLRAWVDRHPVADAPGTIPLVHFLRHGPSDVGFDPHPLFHTAWYLQRYTASSGTTALAHYLRNAEKTQPNRYFASAWYAEKRFGELKGRPPLQDYVEAIDAGEYPAPHPLFDAAWYARTYPDIGSMDPLTHYFRYGEAEGRRPNPFFDTEFYRRRHREDAAARHAPLAHYLAHGRDAGCDPNPFFDTKFYAASQARSGVSCLEHFIAEGEARKAVPHPHWDEELYLNSNPDLLRVMERGDFQSLYRHFVENGAAELTSPKQPEVRRLSFRLGGYTLDYDEATYLEDNADALIAIMRGERGTGLEHFFATGYGEALDGQREVYRSHRFPRLVASHPGLAPRLGKRACLFVHWDRHGIVDDYVLDYLRALRVCGTDIWFITATTTAASELDKVREMVAGIIVKADNGRDFVSWLVAWRALGAETFARYEQLLLVNDSIYFPLFDPAGMFDKMEKLKFDYWGVTDSRDWSFAQYHVQSYFVGLSREAIDRLLPVIIDRVAERPILTKRGQIVEYELAATQIAVSLGLSVGAACPIDDIREDVIRDGRLAPWRKYLQFGLEGLNPTMELWDLLITYYGCPVIKQELLRDNPRELTNIKEWPALLGEHSRVSVKTIKAHLSRIRSTTALRVQEKAGASAFVENNKVAIRETIAGAGFGRGRDLVLLAHYDPQGIIDPYIDTMIDGLRAADCDVAFVTATDKQLELARIRDKVAAIAIKNQAGRDFGSWQVGIEAFESKFPSYESIIWMNDSIYYPLFDPREMFSDMRGRNLDFWGIVDSHNGQWHVMSWFWAFGRKAIQEGIFDWYRREYNPFYTKWAQIRNYEMRIPSMLRSKGCSVGSFITAEQIREFVDRFEPRHARNSGRLDFTMTHDFWDVLIESFRCPALKLELVRDNPLGLDIGNMFQLIEQHSRYDINLIKNHQRRLKTAHFRDQLSLPV
jgi:lipopolysaccharide biosynthesis protein